MSAETTDQPHIVGPFGGLTRGYVRARGLQIHYAHGGTGSQTIVFIHEVPRSWTQFGPALAHISRFAQVIAIDLPGYGGSDEYESQLSARDYATVVAEAVAQLTTEPVWIAGVHSGALFATVIAAHRLLPTRGLLLTGLPLFGVAAVAPQAPPEAALGETYDGSHVGRVVTHFQNKWGHFSPTHRLHDAAVAALQSADRMYAGYRAVYECDAAELLPLLDCEVHFLSAAEDGLFAHDQMAAALIPSAVMCVAAGIDRDVPWSAPLWYSRNVFRAISDGSAPGR